MPYDFHSNHALRDVDENDYVVDQVIMSPVAPLRGSGGGIFVGHHSVAYSPSAAGVVAVAAFVVVVVVVDVVVAVILVVVVVVVVFVGVVASTRTKQPPRC